MSEMPAEITIQAPAAEVQHLLVQFVTERLNRGWKVRDAVAASFKALSDHYGEGSEVRVTEEAFEKTVAYFEQALETYRREQEAGRKPVGSGLYAEVVGDDEYAERIKNQS